MNFTCRFDVSRLSFFGLLLMGLFIAADGMVEFVCMWMVLP